ncbi:MAG: YhcH/YjgK/YiaL family protein [Candidatus Delongbacteria bacterium]|nr:YhcH/YjgK/YiaL family protein [Candidatus Delongbacteria bacterium]
MKMIYDELEKQSKYKHLRYRFEKAFEFLENTDLDELRVGKHIIDGENIFVSVSEYLTKNEGFLEGHQEYIDIQLITKGSEKIGYAQLSDQKVKSSYDKANDIAFFYGECEYLTLIPGDITVFFPEDLHMPGIKNGDVEEVKKIVVKVKI